MRAIDKATTTTTKAVNASDMHARVCQSSSNARLTPINSSAYGGVQMFHCREVVPSSLFSVSELALSSQSMVYTAPVSGLSHRLKL